MPLGDKVYPFSKWRLFCALEGQKGNMTVTPIMQLIEKHVEANRTDSTAGERIEFEATAQEIAQWEEILGNLMELYPQLDRERAENVLGMAFVEQYLERLKDPDFFEATRRRIHAERPLSKTSCCRDALAKFLEYKRSVRRRQQYVRTLEKYLGKFLRESAIEDLPVSAITVGMIYDYLTRVHTAASSTCSAIGRFGSFLEFCLKRDVIDANPIRKLERPTVERKSPVILTPEQARALLETTLRERPKVLGYIALGLFTGIRPAEMSRMQWSDLDLRPRNIKDLKGYGLATVPAEASKVRRRRLVPIPPVALAWLALCDKKTGTLNPFTRADWFTRRLAKGAGFTWTADVLRHSAASYLLAEFEDAGRVAFWLGNSAQILLTHYYSLVQPEDCKAFWRLMPTGFELEENLVVPPARQQPPAPSTGTTVWWTGSDTRST